MRYNVHPLRAVRHRIARQIGVLVCAALVAVLGLPSMAQAQSITTVTYADGPGFGVTFSADRLDTDAVDVWMVTFTNPAGKKVVVTDGTPTGSPVMLNENDLGTWWIQVDACFMALGGADNDECPEGELEEGASVGYTHGAPKAPENLAASLIPDGVYLSWTAVKNDRGLTGYQYSTDGEKWAAAGAAGDGSKIVDAMPGDQTFWVRAQGQSDNDLNTDEGSDGAAESNGAASNVDITVPTAAPTLPEIAALFLALLLLGSGAYLIRRRETLTPA